MDQIENSIEEDIEKKISWKKRINLRNHDKYMIRCNDKSEAVEGKLQDMAQTIQTIRFFDFN